MVTNGESISKSEMMAYRAALELNEGENVFVGIGLPNLACNLAMRLHAPNLFMIYESGVIGTLPERLPVSIGDPTLAANALSICNSSDVFHHYLQRGNIDVGFLGGAQIDPFGNLNSTVIGKDYKKPKTRLPGSGGACEIATHAKKLLIVMRLSPRAFVEECDFVTSPGHVYKAKKRKQWSEHIGAGPTKVITDYGVFSFSDEGRLYLSEVYDGVDPKSLLKKSSFHFEIALDLVNTPKVSSKALKIMREELDPKRLYLK